MIENARWPAELIRELIFCVFTASEFPVAFPLVIVPCRKSVRGCHCQFGTMMWVPARVKSKQLRSGLEQGLE